MIKCIIVDDELKSRESLQILLSDFCEGIRVVALCQNVDEGINAIFKHHPEIVFLDIQMQRETGFDLLSKLPKIDFEIIFTTAFADYAVKAFKFSAIDYLLKPIDISELNAAIDKVKNKLNHDIADRLDQLIQNLNPENEKISRVALPTSNGLIFAKIQEIIYCEASSNYTQFYLTNGNKYLVSKTLKEYEELLSEYNFYRIHNSYLINLESINEYVRGDGGYVIMSNKASLDVSKRKKEGFLKKIGY